MTTFGKWVLISVGAGFGLFRSLRALDGAAGERRQVALVKARIDAIDLAVAHLGEQTAHVHARLDGAVTREELAQRLDRAFGSLHDDVDARFERQTRSVEALRLMVGQTDKLLQKVLDGLESIRNDRDLVETR